MHTHAHARTHARPQVWQALGLRALEMLDIDMAVAAYRMLADASMVLSLEQIRHIEDKNLLAGHVLVLLERDSAAAQVRETGLTSGHIEDKKLLSGHVLVRCWSLTRQLRMWGPCGGAVDSVIRSVYQVGRWATKAATSTCKQHSSLCHALR